MEKKTMISIEDKMYEKSIAKKDRMEKALRELGYQSAEEYADTVSYLAW